MCGYRSFKMYIGLHSKLTAKQDFLERHNFLALSNEIHKTIAVLKEMSTNPKGKITVGILRFFSPGHPIFNVICCLRFKEVCSPYKYTFLTEYC